MPFGQISGMPLLSDGSPTERALAWTATWPREQAYWRLALWWVTVIIVDASTGRLISTATLYLPPLCLTTWCLGRIPGFLSGAGVTAVTLFINGFGDSLSAQASTIPFPAAIWNAAMRIAAAAFIIIVISAFRRTFDRERAQARIDPLTGLGNRRSFEIESRKLDLLAAENGSILLCGVIDIDDFKQVNDQHGHAKGDETLRAVASALTSALRPGDAVARIGGDEFAFCVVVRNRFVAEQKVEELHNRIASALSALPCHPSCTIGASEEKSMAGTFCLADEALYFAKSAGKGRYEFRF